MSGCDQGIGRSRYTVTIKPIIISRSRGILYIRRIKCGARCICLSTPLLNDIKFLKLSIYSLLLFREFNFRQRSLHFIIPVHCLRLSSISPFLLLLPPLSTYFDLFFRSKAFIMSTSAGDFELMDRRSPAQTMTSEPVHGQITFRGNFSIPALPKAFANTREKGRKKKKKRKRLGSRVCFHKDGSVCRPVYPSVDELRTRHQLITNHDTANARASPSRGTANYTRHEQRKHYLRALKPGLILCMPFTPP